MIYISQGYQHSISLEVLFKSAILLSDQSRKRLKLFVEKESLKNTLKLIKIEKAPITTQEFQKSTTVSNDSIYECLNIIGNKDILVTMPTTKNQLEFNNKSVAGHTELFRKYYDNNSISMNFYSPDYKVLLLTDHIPLKEVTNVISEELVIQKISISIDGYKKYFEEIEEVVIAGINPHAGENGILGSEDSIITSAIQKLNKLYPKVHFIGPISGDTLHFSKNTKNQLFVYTFHDQGLSFFKGINGTLGINITFGLPFIRMSVDHGTAPSLYGKNVADYMGSYYVLKTALEVHKRINSGN